MNEANEATETATASPLPRDFSDEFAHLSGALNDEACRVVGQHGANMSLTTGVAAMLDNGDHAGAVALMRTIVVAAQSNMSPTYVDLLCRMFAAVEATK